MMQDVMKISDEVHTALAERRGIVALESTIISHGLPYPDNLATAYALENIVRAEGAVPATIAVVDGQICVGLTSHELERISDPATPVLKLSERDLPVAVAHRAMGATTVAATLKCAHGARIEVFATGGIGGVHRGAEVSFDVSADLSALARTPLAVVSAGAKAILDLPKTVEMLESLGVLVVGYQTDEFPGFYYAKTGIRLTEHTDSVAALAAILQAHKNLGQTAGVLIVQPVPKAFALDQQDVERSIQEALCKAADRGVTAKDVTPFLLKHINTQAGSKTVEANVALVKNNARLAGSLAVRLTLDRQKNAEEKQH